MYRQKNKYGARKTEYNGFKYDSGFEASVAYDLEMRRRAGEILDVQRQVTIPLYVYGRLIAKYRIDFVVTLADGTIEYIEAKGFETDTWRMKWKLFEAIKNEEEPGAILTVIKQQSVWTKKQLRKRKAP